MRDPSDPTCGYPLPDEPIPEVPEPDRPWHLTPEAIQRCQLCDQDGYMGVQVCHHQNPDVFKAAAARGMEQVRKILRHDQD